MVDYGKVMTNLHFVESCKSVDKTGEDREIQVVLRIYGPYGSYQLDDSLIHYPL
jgi:hypothetical protein